MGFVASETGTERVIRIKCRSSARLPAPLSEYTGDLDVQLMIRVREGDLDAFSALWERHRKPLFVFLCRMVSYDFVAEELGQEVFLRVYRARATYEPSARFTTWLYRIASHVGVNWLRDRRHELHIASLEREMPTDAHLNLRDNCPTAEQQMVEGSRLQEIRRAVQELPENQRAAVVLHKYCELDNARVGKILGCSESAVKSLLYRAYGHLRSSLAHFEGTRSAATHA